MKVLHKILAAVLFALLTQCGGGAADDQFSETSAERAWYYYCIKPDSANWFNVNGRMVQKMICSGGGISANVWAGTFTEAQALAQRECPRRAGSAFRLGGAGNFGPGAPGGDISPDNEKVAAWIQANCYQMAGG